VKRAFSANKALGTGSFETPLQPIIPAVAKDSTNNLTICVKAAIEKYIVCVCKKNLKNFIRIGDRTISQCHHFVTVGNNQQNLTGLKKIFKNLNFINTK
jgi:hypothetical protein